MFTIPTANVARLAAKITEANNRLARTTITERFSFTTVDRLEALGDEGVMIPVTDVELSAPMITSGEWAFVAAIVVEEGGVVVHPAPEYADMPIERPSTHQCDHCNVDRARSKSYIVLNTVTGEVKQVGSTCIESFLGIAIKGLWTLEYSADELADMFGDRNGVPREAYRFAVQQVLTIAYVVTEGGKSFVSRKSAEVTGQTASSDDVSAVFFPNMTKVDEVRWANEMRAQAAEVSDDTLEAIKAAVADMRDSEYKDNLTAAIESEHISTRSFGTLVSALGVYARALNLAAERKANPRVQGFLGEAKDKVAFTGTVVGIREVESAWGVTTLLTFRTENGQTAKWWASNAPIVALEDKVEVKGTVKAREQYQGNDETILTRCKVQVLATA